MARKRRSRIPSEIIQVRIDKLSHEGKGIAYHEDKTIFVSDALSGEVATIKFTDKRKGVYFAELIELIDSSPDRVKAPCQFYHMCGGCSLQHLDVDKQIQLKQDLFLQTMKHIGKVEVKELIEPIIGNRLAYRTKTRLGVRYVNKKNKLLIGFREKHSNFLCDMNSCEVLHPSIGKRLESFAELISSLTCRTKIPQIEVAIGEESWAVIIRHLEPLINKDLQCLINFSRLKGFHLLLQPGGPDSIHYVYPHQLPLNEVFSSSLKKELALSYFLPEFNIKNMFLPTDFTQINRVINRQMVHLALSLLDLDSKDRLLDLFCGMGNFSLPLARQAVSVTGVEGNNDLVIRARLNAEENQCENVNFYCADLFKISGNDDFRNQKWAKNSYDKILIDPARSGAMEIVQNIELFHAKVILYVSCNPSTLARDTEILIRDKDYQLIKAGVMDMFPHTAHVESIALFHHKTYKA
ncbi:MAG: 23S rRNA (uracil(1939)-C(5))-methyltransferase RlmD [Gammaproteobacteria bacterium]|nr:23S rRNA (uracil(1939)-C(5))-methyltransferase RlmD [Gammaproteobacteria bacterium]